MSLSRMSRRSALCVAVPLLGFSAHHGSLTVTADMSAPRASHTATALPDGRVLIAGGFANGEHASRGAEVYSTLTERFSALPAMVTLRQSHSATLLPDGKVLLVGGYGADSRVLASAELFDPASNTFISTGALGTARAGHAAVLLRTGKVLIAGGVGDGWRFLASAELYDPATGRFTPTGDMTVARESHIAVRLQRGEVLVVGGHRGRRADIVLFASAETYDPASGVFRRVGDMSIRRHKHDAVLLADGRVLVTGGTDERDNNGVYNSTELFDARTQVFTRGPAMQRPRYKHQGSSIRLRDGTVLIAGGASHAETFDPVRNTFTLVDGTPRMAGQFSAAAPTGDGRVLVTGGYGGGTGPRAAAWLYRP